MLLLNSPNIDLLHCSSHRIVYSTQTLTSTFGPSDEGRSRWPSATLPRSGQKNFNLILHIWVQMPELVSRRIHDVRLGPVASGGAVLHLFQDDGAIADDGVGVWFDPQVGGANCKKLRRSNRCRGRWRRRRQKVYIRWSLIITTQPTFMHQHHRMARFFFCHFIIMLPSCPSGKFLLTN